MNARVERSAIGDAAYDAATARGASMASDEVVAYTLGELDRILAELDDRTARDALTHDELGTTDG